jgi:hypothetical protein
MKTPSFPHLALAILAICSWAELACAAPITQTIALHPGWNAVFLEVQPASTAPAEVFAGVPGLHSVWRRNPATSTVEFIQDPDVPIPTRSQWFMYVPGDPIASTLHAILGETAYLIHMEGSATVDWSINGEPALPSLDWQADAYNYVGVHLAPGEEPFFGDFFAASAAHAGQTIYILNAGGNWEVVANPLTTRMRRGEAFWVYCHGSSTFLGPLSVQLEQGSGLDYGTALLEQTVLLRNQAAAAKAVSLSLSALNDAVYYWVFDPAHNVAGWQPIPAALALDVPADTSQKLRLGVRRVGLAPDTTYQANLTVADDGGTQILVPLRVTGIRYSGLWTGNASITHVSQPARATAPDIPTPTGSEFSFRLLVHADAAGPVRLLSQVMQMWQEGTWKPDPNDLGKQIVDQPGHFVLLVDDALIPDYSGAAMRDGELVGRRISSPAFPSLTAAQGVMGGSAVAGGGFDPSPGKTLTLTVALAADAPTNPFRHLYHPDHNDAVESYAVTRVLTLTFADTDADGKPITGVPSLDWGSAEIGGVYDEQITGLHREALRIKGTFVLHRVSEVGTLTQP